MRWIHADLTKRWETESAVVISSTLVARTAMNHFQRLPCKQRKFRVLEKGIRHRARALLRTISIPLACFMSYLTLSIPSWHAQSSASSSSRYTRAHRVSPVSSGLSTVNGVRETRGTPLTGDCFTAYGNILFNLPIDRCRKPSLYPVTWPDILARRAETNTPFTQGSSSSLATVVCSTACDPHPFADPYSIISLHDLLCNTLIYQISYIIDLTDFGLCYSRNLFIWGCSNGLSRKIIFPG